MLPDERDSEEEDCTSWLKITSMKVMLTCILQTNVLHCSFSKINVYFFSDLKMVDEFIDVNFGEKQFMKVWNSYMMDHK